MLKTAAALALAAALIPASALAKPHGPHGGDDDDHAVPEINATSAGLALVLVVGGAAVVLGRRRKQKSAS